MRGIALNGIPVDTVVGIRCSCGGPPTWTLNTRDDGRSYWCDQHKPFEVPTVHGPWFITATGIVYDHWMCEVYSVDMAVGEHA